MTFNIAIKVSEFGDGNCKQISDSFQAFSELFKDLHNDIKIALTLTVKPQKVEAVWACHRRIPMSLSLVTFIPECQLHVNAG